MNDEVTVFVAFGMGYEAMWMWHDHMLFFQLAHTERYPENVTDEELKAFADDHPELLLYRPDIPIVNVHSAYWCHPRNFVAIANGIQKKRGPMCAERQELREEYKQLINNAKLHRAKIIKANLTKLIAEVAENAHAKALIVEKWPQSQSLFEKDKICIADFLDKPVSIPQSSEGPKQPAKKLVKMSEIPQPVKKPEPQAKKKRPTYAAYEEEEEEPDEESPPEFSEDV